MIQFQTSARNSRGRFLINESEIQEFEQKRIILSMRQESEKMMVRYYSEEEDNNARPCTPNLEDVFLVTYREEK